MTRIDRLLPPEANNGYRGSPIAFYTLIALTLVFLGRSLIHFFKDDSGVNSIATIVTFSGTPDPNHVVYMFSALWGSQQTIMALLYVVVLLRYRNLIPLMYVVILVEIVFRWTVGAIHPLTEEYYLRTPPGKIANLPLLAIAGVMLVLSLGTPGPSRSVRRGR